MAKERVERDEEDLVRLYLTDIGQYPLLTKDDEVDALVVATYRAWSEEATPVAERPVMRVLDLVLRDLDFDAQEGHDLFSAGR